MASERSSQWQRWKQFGWRWRLTTICQIICRDQRMGSSRWKGCLSTHNGTTVIMQRKILSCKEDAQQCLIIHYLLNVEWCSFRDQHHCHCHHHDGHGNHLSRQGVIFIAAVIVVASGRDLSSLGRVKSCESRIENRELRIEMRPPCQELEIIELKLRTLN